MFSLDKFNFINKIFIDNEKTIFDFIRLYYIYYITLLNF